MTIVTCRNPADIRREAKIAAKRAAPKPGADIVPHPVIASTPHHLKLTDGELEGLIECLADIECGLVKRHYDLSSILNKAKARRRASASNPKTRMPV